MSQLRRHILRILPLAAASALFGPTAMLTGCGEPTTGVSTEVSNRVTPSISLDAAIIEGDDQAVYEHILAGTPVTTKSMMGDTPLHIAAAMGRPYAAEVLIGAGADLEAKNSSGVTPLFNAAFFCHAGVLETLIDAGANTKATDQNGVAIRQIMETPWDQMRPIYEMVHRSIGLSFDEKRIEAARPEIAAMLR